MAVQRLSSMALFATVFLGAAIGQPLGKSVISGTVVDGESGDPVRKAVVTLNLQGSPPRWATTRTDSSGRFEFRGLPAGKYRLRAAKANEGTAVYGANSLRELPEILTLGEDEVHPAVRLRLLHAASISGHVYDADGDPVAYVNVTLLRKGRNVGAPILVSAGGSNTDDRGEYHFSSVDPGKYYLLVTPYAGESFMGHRTMLASQFYGGARESKDATPVHVRGGESVAGLDFHLSSEPAVEVRGQVAGIPGTSEAQPSEAASSNDSLFQGEAGPEVTISPAEPGLEGWSNTTMTQAPDYRFQAPDVAAGRYRVAASFHSGGKAYAAWQLVDLQPGSGEILLTLTPAVDIQGTFRVEGQAAAEDAVSSKRAANGFTVKLSRPGTARIAISAEVGADGHFTLKDVAPGDWQLAVTPMPPGYLKSAQFGDKDVRFTTFEIGSRPSPLNIVVSMHTAVVDGEIDAASADSKRAGIVIAPIGEFHNMARYYYGVTADENGKFKVRGIAPGKYKVFALEKMAAAGFRDPEAVDQLDELGETIELAEGATVQAHPKLIPTARALKALP